MDRIRLCGLLTVLAFGVSDARADDWTATSTTALAITGDISVSQELISFENGEVLGISPLGTDARIYQVAPPANPVLLNGNRLCGESTPTFVVLAGEDNRAPAESRALYLKVYDGTEAPPRSAVTGMTGGPGLCAILNYERAAGASVAQSGAPASTAGATELDVEFTILEDAEAAGCLASIVTGLDPNSDGFLAVRSGPGTNYRKIDEIHNGDWVRACARSGPWVGIYYGDPRRRGWAHENWLVDSGAG